MIKNSPIQKYLTSTHTTNIVLDVATVKPAPLATQNYTEKPFGETVPVTTEIADVSSPTENHFSDQQPQKLRRPVSQSFNETSFPLLSIQDPFVPQT